MTNQPNYRIVRIFHEPPAFDVRDTVADFPGRPSRELYEPVVQWDEIAAEYGPSLHGDATSWREKVLNLSNPEVLENSDDHSPLRCNFVVSHDIRMARDNSNPRVSANDLFQLASGSIIRTRDDYIIMGSRGTPPGQTITEARLERFASPMFGFPAGGSVSYRESYNLNPIADTITDEFAEEIGPRFEITKQRLIGVFEAGLPGPTGYNFLTLVDTDATALQIQRDNFEARVLFWGLIGKSDPQTSKELEHAVQEAREMLKRKNFPLDAWEHDSLSRVRNDKVVLENKLLYDELPGITAGALATYTSVFDEVN